MLGDYAILSIIAAAVLVVAACALAIPWLKRGPRGELFMGLVWRTLRPFCFIFHRARFVGFESLRDQQYAGPLIVISNHTGAIDPILIQAACRFHIRWMMASDMMTPLLNWLWRSEKVIPVDRDGRDSAAAREAIRHVQAGGVIGIFPEGRIVLPPEQIRPFHTGVGLLAAKTKARVLLVWVSGTPSHQKPTPAKSILTPSLARVQFIELMDFQNERDAMRIAQQLRESLAAVSHWPLNDEPMPKE